MTTEFSLCLERPNIRNQTSDKGRNQEEISTTATSAGQIAALQMKLFSQGQAVELPVPLLVCCWLRQQKQGADSKKMGLGEF